MAQALRRYENKVALVLGGAAGIGLATSERLAAEGARLAIADFAVDAGEATCRRLAAEGAEVRFLPCDGTKEADIQRAVEGVCDHFGRLDVAINIVGGHASKARPHPPLHEMSLEDWDATADRNLHAAFLAMKHEIIAMLRTGGGAIANTSSMAGLRATPHASPAYSAAKAGVAHLTRVAAISYAAQNIRVNAVAPGLTGSPAMTAKFTQEARAAMVADFHPLGRLVSPQSQAAAFAWLCSDDAADITGLVVPVDGGWAAK